MLPREPPREPAPAEHPRAAADAEPTTDSTTDSGTATDTGAATDAALLRALVAAAPDPLLAVDSTGRIVFANDRTEELFGWPPDELLGRVVEDLVPADVAELHREHRARYLRDPRPRPMGAGLQLTALRRDGSLCPVDISLNAVPDVGLVLVAVRDVTARVELEHERRRRELDAGRQRARRLASLGELAGGIAHDFNNLLGVIVNYVGLLERQVADDRVDLAAVTADLGQIRAAAQRGSALTRHLLAFALHDLGAAEPIDVVAVLDEIAPVLRDALPDTVALALNLPTGPVAAVVTRHSLEQVLLNLSANARDAMPTGGTVTVSVGVDRDAGQVTIEVTDTGCGMSPDVQARAFEPFFTTKPRGQGTGLGLATVFGIARGRGGDVQVRSAVGEGTTVTVTLPTAEESPPAPAEVAGPGEVGRARVLLVEDKPALRESTARLLSEHGYDVAAASDGIEALGAYEADPSSFDLVLTDVVMPGLRGDELAARIATRDPALPIVFVTGYDPDSSAAGRRVLRKPFTTRELLTAIRDELGR